MTVDELIDVAASSFGFDLDPAAAEDIIRGSDSDDEALSNLDDYIADLIIEYGA